MTLPHPFVLAAAFLLPQRSAVDDARMAAAVQRAVKFRDKFSGNTTVISGLRTADSLALRQLDSPIVQASATVR
jgi:hypothetical protein